MIEFNGYLSGNAKRKFHDSSRKFGQNILLASLFLLLPMVIYLAIRMNSWLILCMYCSLFVVFPLLMRIPKGKKESLEITPKRIYTDGEYIICVADKYTESRLIGEVSKVLDFGEFYVLVFPFGRVSDKFVCQKDLLIKGSIEEFEALFEGKIECRYKTENTTHP